MSDLVLKSEIQIQSNSHNVLNMITIFVCFGITFTCAKRYMIDLVIKLSIAVRYSSNTSSLELSNMTS